METMNEQKALVSAYTLRYEKSAVLNDVISEYGQCKNPEQFLPLIRQMYSGADICPEGKEYAFAILLNNHLVPVGYIMVSEGGTDVTVIDRRLIVKAALDLGAKCVILVHNHPSGSPIPGTADLKQTAALRHALKLFDMKLLDHIVYTPKRSYSFAEEKTFSSQE